MVFGDIMVLNEVLFRIWYSGCAVSSKLTESCSNHEVRANFLLTDVWLTLSCRAVSEYPKV